MKDNKNLTVSNSILAGALIIGLSIFFGLRPSLEERGEEAGEQLAAAGSEELTITEFSDFQCPYCQMFWQNAYQEIKAKYVDTGKIKFIYRHYPLPNHPDAFKAAEASECARDQGKFWEYHDTLFSKLASDGSGLDVPSLKSYAKDLGLDSEAFNSCLDGGEKTSLVLEDSLAGQKAGVDGTPTFFIGDEKVIGAQPASVFEVVIDKLLK